jgi:aminopeptidase 2
MEHWGCVSYTDKGLLLGQHASELEKLQVAYLVTHELAHQWFGNIVTMKWWDSAWLNEAFADWATVHALSQMLPDWDAWDDFVAAGPDRTFAGGYQTALDLDANTHSHAILDPNIPPAVAFDSITYLKGCCIIRMLAEELGVSVFLVGIRHYLNRHLFGNGTTDDLWDALSVVSGQDVAGIMDAWTKTVGYPLLTVNEVRPTRELVVTQSRFLQNGDEDTEVGPYPISIHLHSPDGVVRREMRGRRGVAPAATRRWEVGS